MSTPQTHPTWNAIKRGMLIGALAGLNLAFLLIMQSLSNIESPFPYPTYPPQLEEIFQDIMTGAGMGLGFGAVLGVLSSWLRRPHSRMESDLKAAAELRAKELINDADYQSLKANILGSYQADSTATQRIASSAFWWGLIGGTIALGGLASNMPSQGYPSGTSIILSYVLPLVAVGTGIGTAIAAIIQAGLQSKPSAAQSAPKPGMLGVGQFDPLDSIRTTEAQPATNRR